MVTFPALDSYATALVLLPPPQVQQKINSVRSGNDKSHPRWTAHITLLFPFVAPTHLDAAVESLRDALRGTNSTAPFPITLNRVGSFPKKDYATVHLAPAHSLALQSLHTHISQVARYTGRSFVPHLTIGQAIHRKRGSSVDDADQGQDAFIREAGELLLERSGGSISWKVGALAVLVKDERDGGRMKAVASIPLDTDQTYTAVVAPERPLTHLLGPVPKTLSDNRISIMTYNILSSTLLPPTARFTQLKAAFLAAPTPTIVTLQEVPTAFLPVLLSDPDITTTYPYSTHAPTSVLPHLRNVLVLSALPFEWHELPLGASTRIPGVLCTFELPRTSQNNTQNPRKLVLLAAHLPAGHTPAHRARRTSALGTAHSYLSAHHPRAEWVLAGDLNLDDGPEEGAIHDTRVWRDTWSASDEGSGHTFVPAENALAARTSRVQGAPPFRYDRVLVRARGGLGVREAQVRRCKGSDHWPLYVELEVGDESLFGDEPGDSSLVIEGTDSTMEEDLDEFVREAGCALSPAQDAQRRDAVEVLRELLLGERREYTPATDDTVSLLPRPAPFEICVVGSRALGVDGPTSDVDVLVVGSLSPRAFVSLVRARVAAFAHPQQHGDIKIVRFVFDARIPTLDLRICDEKLEVQYACAPSILSRWNTLAELHPAAPIPATPAPIQRTLASYRDAAALAPFATQAFGTAYRALGAFLRARGLSGARFGFIGGGALAVMLACTSCRGGSPDERPAQLVRRFVEAYASFAWDRDAVELAAHELCKEHPAAGGAPSAPTTTIPLYSRGAREPLVVLSPTRPRANLCAAATPPSVRTLATELGRACRLLRAGWAWREVCARGERAFLESASSGEFVRVDLSWWDGAPGARVRGWVEARLVHLVVDLHKQHAHTAPRIWPGAFVPTGTEGGEAVYLISLDAALPPMVHALRTFEGAVEREAARGQKGACDPAGVYVGVSIASAAQVRDLELADGWQDEDETPLEEEVEEVEHDEEPVVDPAAIEETGDRRPLKTSDDAPRTKLRTSADVYNRLMWDPSASEGAGHAGYLIGYEDRFVGVKEVPLAAWKREIEDEAFIPFHRVVHFRRVADGKIVWDRRTRTDLVFSVDSLVGNVV